MQKFVKLMSVVVVLFGSSVAYAASADNDRDRGRWDNNRGNSASAQTRSNAQSRGSRFSNSAQTRFSNGRPARRDRQVAQVRPTPSVPELDSGAAVISLGLLLALGGVVRERRRRQSA